MTIRRSGLSAVAFAFGLLLVVQLATPEPAAALAGVNLNPLDALPSLDPGSWATDGFRAILEFIFGKSLDEIGRHLLGLLLAVPLVTDHHAFPRLNAYRDFVTAGAWGLLGLTGIVAIFRYWLSSFTGSGAYEAMVGFFRSAGAIAMLLMFPVAFDGISRGINMFTAALVKGPTGSTSALSNLLSTAAISSGGIGMIVAVFAIFTAIVLLIVKVVVTVLIAILWAASPLAIVLWPVQELGWILRSLLQALGALLIFPVLWALCFGVFAVLPVDAMFPGSYGDAIESVLSPLVGLAALIIAARLPFAVMERGLQAGIMPSPSRGITHVRNVSYARSAVSKIHA